MSKQVQNSMSAATDKGVLAVMDRDAGNADNFCEAIEASALLRERFRTESREARTTVAELIAMATIANESLNAHGIGLSRGDGLTLAAALARCGGAQS